MAEGQTPQRKQIDWEAIDREYAAGMLSVREIARRYSCSETAIRKRAKAEGWERDLSARVQKEVRRKLVREGVRSEASEREIVEHASETGVTIVKLHRSSVQRAQRITEALLEQLSEFAGVREEIEKDIAKNTKGDYIRRARMLKAVALPTHAGVLRDLSLAQKNLIALERQAYNLNGHSPEDGESLKEIILRGIAAQPRSD